MAIVGNTNATRERAWRNKVLKRSLIYTLVSVTVIFAALFVAMNIFIPIIMPLYNSQYSMYFALVELGIGGFFVIRTLSRAAYRLIADTSESQARTARSMVLIGGYLVVIAIAVALMAQNPAVTVVIGTVTGIVLGVAMQSLIGNAIAGMVLAIVRPFKIGDTITVFGNTGKVYDIGLLYTTMTTPEGKTILVPNTSLLTTSIIKERVSNLQAPSETA